VGEKNKQFSVTCPWKTTILFLLLFECKVEIKNNQKHRNDKKMKILFIYLFNGKQVVALLDFLLM
jgi:hypothetical protein